MFRPIFSIAYAYALLSVTGLAFANQQAPEEGDEPQGVQNPGSGGSLACSLAARDRYIEDARAAGILVEGQGEDIDVIARSEEEKIVLERLYLKQLDDLAVCQEG